MRFDIVLKTGVMGQAEERGKVDGTNSIGRLTPSDFGPREALRAYPPGSAVVLPGSAFHFHRAQSGEYVTQVSGTGPLGLEYKDVRDDRRFHDQRPR